MARTLSPPLAASMPRSISDGIVSASSIVYMNEKVNTSDNVSDEKESEHDASECKKPSTEIDRLKACQCPFRDDENDKDDDSDENLDKNSGHYYDKNDSNEDNSSNRLTCGSRVASIECASPKISVIDRNNNREIKSCSTIPTNKLNPNSKMNSLLTTDKMKSHNQSKDKGKDSLEETCYDDNNDKSNFDTEDNLISPFMEGASREIHANNSRKTINSSDSSSPLSKQSGSIATEESPASSEGEDSRDDDIIKTFKTKIELQSRLSYSGSTYEANNPSEDRFASLINVLLTPTVATSDTGVTNKNEMNCVAPPLIRLSFFCVLDGHGGSSVSNFASQALLPLLSTNIARSLHCTVLYSGQFRVCGQPVPQTDWKRYLVKNEECAKNRDNYTGWYKAPVDICENRHSLSDHDGTNTPSMETKDPLISTSTIRNNHEQQTHSCRPKTPHSTGMKETIFDNDAQTNRQKTKVGMHSRKERHQISQCISRTFIEMDERWMNTINPNENIQTCCVSNGKWNAGTCCLVTLLVQRLEYSNHLNGYGPAISYDDGNSNVDIDNDNGAMLYTAHVGDCRAILLRGSNNQVDVNFRHDFKGKHCGGDKGSDSEDEESISEQDNDDSSVESDEEESFSSSSSGLDDDEFEDEVDRYKKRNEDELTNYCNLTSRVMKGLHTPSKRSCLSRTFTTTTSATSTGGLRFPIVAKLRLGCSALSNDECAEFNVKGRNEYKNNDDAENDMENEHSSPFNDFALSNEPIEQIKQVRTKKYASRSLGLPPPLPKSLHAITLTKDHTPYNKSEATYVRMRSKHAHRAISTASSGGIKRVAGSLSVTRALGDAYLKTPILSFSPYKKHAPYITATPEISWRRIRPGGLDRVLVLGSDGIWERVGKNMLKKWIEKFYSRRGSLEYHGIGKKSTNGRCSTYLGKKYNIFGCSNAVENDPDISRKRKRDCAGIERSLERSSNDAGLTPKERRFKGSCNVSPSCCNSQKLSSLLCKSKISNVIIRKVLNKVRRTRNMKSLQSLMDLPRGRPRRIRHDDITACIVDLSGFVS